MLQQHREMEAMLRSRRMMVPLPEGKSIGLELDFWTQASTEMGIRVSRVDAGGVADRRGVRQEDRLVVVGGVNVRGWGHALIREMLVRRNGTLQLEFERPLPQPPQPRGNADGDTGRSTSTGTSSTTGGASTSAVNGSDVPVETATQKENTAAPAAMNPRPTDSEPGRQDATPAFKQHQLYRKLSGIQAKSTYTAAAAAALAKMTGASAPSTATSTDTPFPIRKRRRNESVADKGPVTPSPQTAHAPGDMLEQLDFLVAQQQQSQERAKQASKKQGVSLAPPPRRSPPPRPPPPPPPRPPAPPVEGVNGAKRGILAVDIVRQQLQEEDEHQQQLEQQRRQRQPSQQQHQHQRREREQHPGNTAAAKASGAASGAPPLPATASSADTTAATRRPRRRPTKQQQQQKDGGKRAESIGNGVNTPSSALSSTTSSPPPSPPPPSPWLDVLLGLDMVDFAGSEGARAAVVVGEVREMEDKELMLLRRLHKVEPNMTFEEYAAFRSASLRGSSAAYADLEALQRQHLNQHRRWQEQERAKEEKAHHGELADLAMNGSFVSNLLLPEGCRPSEPVATAEPPRSPTASHVSSLSPTTTSEAGNGSSSSGSNGGIAKDSSSDGDGGGGGGGGGFRPPQRRSRRRRKEQQQQEETRQEHRQDEHEGEGQRPLQQRKQQPQKEWKPKPLSEKDVKTARAQVKATAERIKFVKETHGGLQAVIRRSLACHERAVAIGDAHRAARRQCLQDVKETREAGRKTEKQAKEVLGKIRTWERTARAGEELALEAAGAATQRAETLRDAVELLTAGMEKQNARMECLAMFRMLNGPMGAASSDSSTATSP